MIVVLLGADAEPQYHHIQERRLRQLHTTGTVVVTGMEVQLVHPER